MIHKINLTCMFNFFKHEQGGEVRTLLVKQIGVFDLLEKLLRSPDHFQKKARLKTTQHGNNAKERKGKILSR
jgi:hypothetical protein